jgi:glutamate formiminotransferase/formiminotetrahydrofolate cyclodeaminase
MERNEQQSGAARRLLECVPNFSEGRTPAVIKQITDVIEEVEGVRLLDVDPGRATNRTVVTFVGAPEAVCEAAFRAVKKASEVIDMRRHHGEHPRFGATDVLPLVPLSGVTMDEAVALARALGKRIGDEIQIPVYAYEWAAFDQRRRNLAYCRAGEYEGLNDKLAQPDGRPDFGPAVFVPKTGAVAVGARNFLIAYNVNLNTTSTRRANAIAFDVREKGRPVREGNPYTGKIKTDSDGNEVWQPGLLKAVKGIGWYIEEYGRAQVSMNLTDLAATPLHLAFDTVCDRAQARGLRVTGSELVGLVPLKAMLDAGKYFLEKQQRSTGVADEELIRIAVCTMGLDELTPFDPKKKIIEYLIEDTSVKKLTDKSLTAFANETASESPAPGGGSVAACVGALGIALGGMVANLSAHKPGWDEQWHTFSGYAEEAKEYRNRLLFLVDEDTRAFNKIMEAFGLPKESPDEKTRRRQAIQEATRYAAEVPFRVMSLCCESMQVIKTMAEIGNPHSISDAGVGALAARAGVRGAWLNVKINAAGLDDRAFVEQILRDSEALAAQAEQLEREILALCEKVIHR